MKKIRSSYLQRDLWVDQVIKLVLQKKGYKLTKKQLKKWNLKYHKLIMGKPSYDVLVDDKNLNFQKLLIKFKKNLKKNFSNEFKN